MSKKWKSKFKTKDLPKIREFRKNLLGEIEWSFRSDQYSLHTDLSELVMSDIGHGFGPAGFSTSAERYNSPMQIHHRINDLGGDGYVFME